MNMQSYLSQSILTYTNTLQILPKYILHLYSMLYINTYVCMSECVCGQPFFSEPLESRLRHNVSLSLNTPENILPYNQPSNSQQVGYLEIAFLPKLLGQFKFCKQSPFLLVQHSIQDHTLPLGIMSLQTSVFSNSSLWLPRVQVFHSIRVSHAVCLVWAPVFLAGKLQRPWFALPRAGQGRLPEASSCC